MNQQNITVVEASESDIRPQVLEEFKDEMQELCKQKLREQRTELEPEIRREVEEDARSKIKAGVRERLRERRKALAAEVRAQVLDELGSQDEEVFQARLQAMLDEEEPEIRREIREEMADEINADVQERLAAALEEAKPEIHAAVMAEFHDEIEARVAEEGAKQQESAPTVEQTLSDRAVEPVNENRASLADISEDEMMQRLDDYLDSHTDEFGEDTVAKIRERRVVVDDPDRPAKLVFDVERHRGWLGSRYEPGHPMGSFITYWERRAFDPQANTLESLGNVRPSEFTVGACEDPFVLNTSIDIEPLGDGSYQVSESMTNSTAIVRNVEDLELFVENFVSELDYDTDVELLNDALAPGQAGDCHEQMIQAIQDGMMSTAQQEWERVTRKVTRSSPVRANSHA